jgi:hypothetical protein
MIGCSVGACQHVETRSRYTDADAAMYKHHTADHPDSPRQALPKAAVELIADAAERDWRIGVGHGRDSGNAPFVTVQLAIKDPDREYRLTWHTRGTGTYRLFSKIYRGERQWWTDAPSVKAIRTYITETEVRTS